MELIEGVPLKGPLPVDQALKYAVQICDALDAAHKKGITHRDLKPGNILVTKAGIKLLDFGLAKLASAKSGAGQAPKPDDATLTMALTGKNEIVGTLYYMSPEQLQAQANGQEIDAHSDIFSFGIVLYEILTGKRAFEGASPASVIAAIMERPAPSVADIAPPALDRVLKVCLAKDPDERWQTARDLKRELEWIASGSGDTIASSAPSRLSKIAVVAAAIFALAAIAIAFVHFRETPEPRPLVRFTVSPPADAIRPYLDGFAISPDGQLLAFVAEGPDRVARVFVRHIDSPDAQPLAGTERATPYEIFWAPDSRSIGFGKDGGVYRSDLGVSPPKRLCDVPGDILTGGSWSQGGVIVFSGPEGALSRVADTGGAPTPVTSLDAAAKEAGHFGPWFLPDGRHFLFLALATGQTRGTIWAASIDNPTRTRVSESSGPAAYADGWLFTATAPPRGLYAQPFDPEHLKLSGAPQPVRDRLIAANTVAMPAFSLSNKGTLVVSRLRPITSQLTWMDRTGHATATLGARASIRAFALAPDERRAIAEVTDYDAGKSDLWLFEGEKDSTTRLTYEGGTKINPLWALDGRHIYFTQYGATPIPRTMAIGAAKPTAFENSGPFSGFQDLTRDGKYIVFRSTKVPLEVWIQRVGSTERRALVQGQFGAWQARVSADSRWLAYTLQLPSGSEIFVQPFDRPGERIQVSVKGGFGPVWRDDGRELYYEGPEGLMAVPMTERNGALVAGTPQKLFSIHTQGYVVTQPHNVEVAAHGQKFLVNTIVGDSDNVPLEVTLNWQAGLKK
jgi:eukaryotic-like serine/threonine-protein kinase